MVIVVWDDVLSEAAIFHMIMPQQAGIYQSLMK
jgi:hypothetical protein